MQNQVLEGNTNESKKMNSMIIHVFTAERFHLVPTIIKGFLQLDLPQYYILARTKKDARDSIYEELFYNYKNDCFAITHSFEELKRESNNFKNTKIILHGVPYKWMLFYHIRGFKDINWVCWGAGARINWNNWKSILFTPFKKNIYRRFNKIGVLMPQDELHLKKDYSIKKTTLLSYFGTIGYFPYSINDLNKDENRSKGFSKVYLGNNSSSLKTYLPLVEELSKFKDFLFINCMINYTFKESKTSLKLREVGSAIYRDNFFMDETLYSLEDYYKYMNECDIYICNVKSQSGLGAIFTCLRLGKKVFLSGINYEFIKSLGAFIYHVSEISTMSKEIFVENLSYENKIRNYKVIDDYLNKEAIVKRWLEFFKN